MNSVRPRRATPDLNSYRKKNGRQSFSRLVCESCGGKGETPSKRFVDRDLNAALNILKAGTSAVRPEHLSRKRSKSSEEPDAPGLQKKRKLSNKRPVAAGRTSSDSTLANVEACSETPFGLLGN